MIFGDESITVKKLHFFYAEVLRVMILALSLHHFSAGEENKGV